ncbi:DUF655 domain-containing protein [Candidatus Woesearchaeota archaeon]|nr:DUF655 domain-containing protein [Candidatus Woesearchaeota archaeon]
MEQKPIQREEYAVVLDFLPNGYPEDLTPSHRKSPVIQALGKKHFSLLELTAKKDVFLQPYEEIYVGENRRDKVQHVIGRLAVEKLTEAAKKELEFVIKDIIKKNETQFVEFFNTAQPLTTRMHQLELLPGLGKKHMWEIIEKREEKRFESFHDLRERVRLMPDPEKIIMKRILAEINGGEKHNVFVDSPPRTSE